MVCRQVSTLVANAGAIDAVLGLLSEHPTWAAAGRQAAILLRNMVVRAAANVVMFGTNLRGSGVQNKKPTTPWNSYLLVRVAECDGYISARYYLSTVKQNAWQSLSFWDDKNFMQTHRMQHPAA